MSRKVFVLISLFVMMSMVLAACAQPTPTEAPAPVVPTEAPAPATEAPVATEAPAPRSPNR